ncbi:hypothetical protein BU15DRAFT_69802 [Melanogaster broomeanus]|nr:hypothetical protein BU15DRAFT_69802 [Melanogaster broomeanus]
MAALPPFIELMASLGINDREPTHSPPHITPTRSRSGSCSSMSSTASSNLASGPISPSSESFSRDIDVDRRHASARLRTIRYSPYNAASSTARPSTSSSTSLAPSIEEQESGRRSTSPRSSSSPHRNRPSSLQFAKNTRELHASTPISSYVRRRTPQNSPIAATFPHRIPSERPETITLPSLLPASISH